LFVAVAVVAAAAERLILNVAGVLGLQALPLQQSDDCAYGVVGANISHS